MSIPTPSQPVSAAATPLPTSAVEPSSATSISKPQEYPLPPPETFDILPALHELLSRLLTSSNDPSLNGANLDGTKPDAADMTVHTAGQSQAEFSNGQPTYQHQHPLSVQQLAAEVSSIRNRIRRGREAVKSMPDVDRTVEEQEKEIVELKEEVARQLKMLKGLGSVVENIGGGT